MIERLRYRIGTICDAHPYASALIGFSLVFALLWFGGRFEIVA